MQKVTSPYRDWSLKVAECLPISVSIPVFGNHVVNAQFHATCTSLKIETSNVT